MELSEDGQLLWPLGMQSRWRSCRTSAHACVCTHAYTCIHRGPLVQVTSIISCMDRLVLPVIIHRSQAQGLRYSPNRCLSRPKLHVACDCKSIGLCGSECHPCHEHCHFHCSDWTLSRASKSPEGSEKESLTDHPGPKWSFRPCG